MTPRQRVETALRHRTPDRTPVFEYVLQSPIADAILGRPYSPCNFEAFCQQLGYEAAVRQLAVDQLDLALKLGHDLMYVCPNPPPAVSSPAQAPDAPNGHGDDPVEKIRHRNRLAAKAPQPPQECYLVYRFLREEMTRRNVDLPILGPAFAHGICSDVDLVMTIQRSPEAAHRHFELATDHSLATIEQLIAAGVDLLGIGGDVAGYQPLISPENYRTFIGPEIRKLSRGIHRAGKWAVNASDGNLWPLIGEFLTGTEADAYLEIDSHAGMDMARLKRQFGRQVTLMGNLDCGNVLSLGSEDDIRMHVHQCLQAGEGEGGHILCASSAITAAVPLRNYLAAVNAYRDFFGLPKCETAT